MLLKPESPCPGGSGGIRFSVYATLYAKADKKSIYGYPYIDKDTHKAYIIGIMEFPMTDQIARTPKQAGEAVRRRRRSLGMTKRI